MGAAEDNANYSSEDAVCDHFVDWWANSGGESLESFLERLPDPVPRPATLVIKLIAREIELARRSGRTPTLGDYRRRFPHVPADRLEDLWNLPERPPTRQQKPSVPARYRLLREIGQGGIGVIWEVQDRRLNRHSALKTLRDRYGQRPAARLRLQREALLTGSLEHPGIPAIHDRGHLDNGTPFFVMKLVRGQTLDALLAGMKPDQRANLGLIETFRQIAQTIAYAHACGVIHRDLKPQNMMVGEFGEVQIMDWGMAKQLGSELPPHDEQSGSTVRPSAPPSADLDPGTGVDSVAQIHDPTLTRHGDVLGTPAYMSPEQARGHRDDLDQRADVFGLGAVLFEILTGHRLYQNVPSKHLLAAVAQGQLEEEFGELETSEELEAARAPLHRPLRMLCRACLATDPAMRPADGQQVADQVQEYLESVEQRLRQSELDRSRAQLLAREERKRRKLTMWLAGTIGVALVAFLVAGLWYQWDREQMRRASEQQRARTLVTSLGTSPPEALSFAIENLSPIQALVVTELQREWQQPSSDRSQLQAAIALAHLGHPETQFLIEQLESISDGYLQPMVDALRADPENAGPMLGQAFDSAKDDQQRARLAWVSLNLGDRRLAEQMTTPDGDARTRMAFIRSGQRWAGYRLLVLDEVSKHSPPLTTYSVLCALALQDPETVDPETRNLVAGQAELLWRMSRPAEVHAAAESLMRKWGHEPSPLSDGLEWDREAQWSINSLGMVLVPIDLPAREDDWEERFGGYRIEVGDREVTIRQFRRFLAEDREAAERLGGDPGAEETTFEQMFEQNLRLMQIQPPPDTLPDDQQPVACVSICDAMRFCNWLSRREGLIEAYRNVSSESARSTYYQSKQSEQWEPVAGADGYRLPQFSEHWYLATQDPRRYTSRTTYFAMLPEDQLEFEWVMRNASNVKPVATRLPNRLGLFDVMGNLAETGDLQRGFVRNGSTYCKSHVLGFSFQDPKIDSSFTMPQMALAAHNYRTERGFRVMRCSVKDSLKRRTVSLLKRVGSGEFQISKGDATGELKLGIGATAGRDGLELMDLERHEDSLRAFDLAQNALRQAVVDGYDPQESRRLLGGALVNEAIALRTLGRLEEAKDNLVAAEAELKAFVNDYPQDRLGQRYLLNARRVQGRIRVPEIASTLSQRIEERDRLDEVRDELLGLHRLFGESDFLVASLLAQTQFLTGQQTQAIETQQRALELAPDGQQREQAEAALDRYRRDAPATGQPDAATDSDASTSPGNVGKSK